MPIIRRVYRVFRSIFFTAILTVVGLFVLLYMAILLPPVQNQIRLTAEKELSKLFGTDVSIGYVYVSPSGEAILEDVAVPCPDGSRFATIERLGAGIDLTDLVFNGKIVITYAEIIGLDGHLVQPKKNSPWNLQFLVDALSPKDKTKPPTKFDLRLRNVVIRRSSVSVDREWMPRRKEGIDFGHLAVTNLRADLTLPRIKNDDFTIDLRRLSLKEKSGLDLRKLACRVHLTKQLLTVDDLLIELPGSTIVPGNFKFTYEGYADIVPSLKRHRYDLQFDNVRLTPADFAPFYPPLARLKSPVFITTHLIGTVNSVEARRFDLNADPYGLNIGLKGRVTNPADNRERRVIVDDLRLALTGEGARTLLAMVPGLKDDVKGYITRLGGVNAHLKGQLLPGIAKAAADIRTGIGNVIADGTVDFSRRGILGIDGHVETPGFAVGTLLQQDKLGLVAVVADADVTLAGNDVNGHAKVNLNRFDFSGRTISGVLADVTKAGNRISGSASVDDAAVSLKAKGDVTLAGKATSIDATVDIAHINPAAAGLSGTAAKYIVSGHARAAVNGIDPETFTGEVNLSDFTINGPHGPLSVDYLNITAGNDNGGDTPQRILSLRSPFVDGDVTGHFDVARLPAMAKTLLAQALPSAFEQVSDFSDFRDQNITYNLIVKNNNTLTEYFKLPVRMLTDITLDGSLDGRTALGSFNLDVPYLQQGKDKLIRDTRLSASFNGDAHSAMVECFSTLPGKTDAGTALSFSALGINDNVQATVGWNLNRPTAYRGKVAMRVAFNRDLVTGKRAIGLKVIPSTFQVNDTIWHVAAGKVDYSDKKVSVRDVSVWRANQFVKISGNASENPEDAITVDMRDIDLNYVFETLRINYVTFGGRATGKAIARNIFNFKEMEAYTEDLKVKSLSYNGGVLGDADLSGRFLPKEMLVKIGAEISEKGRPCASVNGGVWVGRDSLGFDMKTDKINIKFLQPFMQAFSSDISGRASGHVNLFGTFSDIDLTGRVLADTIAMKIDYTNVVYTGSNDSVYLDSGRIRIPEFRIRDRFGRTALVDGEVTHEFFHNPKFNFTIRDARDLLCYDTNSKMNPDWYGTIFGNGGGSIVGRPGYVGITVDMGIAPKSVFTFVLNDTEAASDYDFLSFSDRRAELIEEERLRHEAENDTIPEFVKAFRKKHEEQAVERPSIFALDINVTSISPQAEMILVMDPVGGDRIRAHGTGGMRLGYDSASDELTMYGKYTLADGMYNFTLQDLILKDFTIRPGSSIAFEGDPLKARLNIRASYRVNTNLTDLDKSFANDRDLNRTNVPVDAVLSVTGDLESPDIKFDIELPTLTQDVTRKVKSIISTEDMMSRQIIYLLALNRFYTPEYMGGNTNTGSEWVSVASETVTSQLANMISQLTDKFTLSPSVRTDKGDFSDTEFDVALSSRLLDNRLLLNGNFGYRDRSTSNTTFVGDFDIEYLLNRRGSLRLKAYNHFNDQNYYLKSALTTQGIGIIYRQDFDNILSFLRRRKKNERDTVPADSVATSAKKGDNQ